MVVRRADIDAAGLETTSVGEQISERVDFADRVTLDRVAVLLDMLSEAEITNHLRTDTRHDVVADVDVVVVDRRREARQESRLKDRTERPGLGGFLTQVRVTTEEGDRVDDVRIL